MHNIGHSVHNFALRVFRVGTLSIFFASRVWNGMVMYRFAVWAPLYKRERFNSRSSRRIATDHGHKPKHAEEVKRTSETI